MTLSQYIYSRFRKTVLCRLGVHGPKFDLTGSPANFCCWGCGHAFNPNAYRPWIVTLCTGEALEVMAVNEYHAGSRVVYDAVDRIDGKTGQAMAEVKCHRDNIASIRLIETA